MPLDLNNKAPEPVEEPRIKVGTPDSIVWWKCPKGWHYNPDVLYHHSDGTISGTCFLDHPAKGSE
jgi:hypothetical protein